MSSELINGILHFNCDEPGCRKNFECQPGEFRSGWKEARDAGWGGRPVYEGNISTWKHACPEHEKRYG